MAARVGIEQLCDNKNSHISNLHHISRHNYLLMHTVQKIPELTCLQVVSLSLSLSLPLSLPLLLLLYSTPDGCVSTHEFSAMIRLLRNGW